MSTIRFPAHANPRRQPANAKGNFFIIASNKLFMKSISQNRKQEHFNL